MILPRIHLLIAVLAICPVSSVLADSSDPFGVVDPADEAALRMQEAIKTTAQSSLRTSLNPRRFVSLDGLWDFKKSGSESFSKIKVPGNWQSQIAELRGTAGEAEYRKRITIPAQWTGEPWIVFGAVDYIARVSVNDRYVGFHEGGYTPFAFNLADFVKPGEQADITLTVEDSSAEHSIKDYPFAEIPHGKQAWYGNISGPWQSVKLEERATTHVKLLRVTPNLADSRVSIEVTLSQSPPMGAGQLLTTIYSPGLRNPVAQSKIDLSSSQVYTFTLAIPQAQFWSPDDPKLYTINTSVVTDQGRTVDEYATRFGMRSIEARNGRLYLNGQPLFVTGALDQDYYPITDYTVPSEAYLRDQFQKAKRLGFNLLRCHIKAPDPLYLSLADEMGLLVWYDVPNVDVLTPKSRARLTDTLRGMLNRDYNHPSLIMVSIINEAWGIDVNNSINRQWLISAYDFAKSLDTTRLIIDNSPCSPNFHMKTDVADFHKYSAIPDHADEWISWLTDFKARAAWLFSPHGDAIETGREPLIVSEFGNWGLPNLQTLRECNNDSLPWWFRTGDGNLRPEGIEQRFQTQTLNRIFGDITKLARSTQDAQMRAFRWQVEELRKHPEISGYVWTELTDIQWEANGIMDFCRNVKASGAAISFVQQPRCIFTRVSRHSIRSGQSVAFDVWGSNFGDSIGGATAAVWQLEGFPGVRGSINIANPLSSADARKLGIGAFTAPPVNSPRIARLQIKWMNDDKVLAQNYEDIAILPLNDTVLSLRVYVDPLLPNASAVIEWLNQSKATTLPTTFGADIAIINRITPPVMKWVVEGGRAILIATDAKALGRSSSNLRIIPRTVAGRWGDWASAFSWFDKSNNYSWLPTRSPMLDWGFDRIIPDMVIDGLTASEWPDVDSGLFVAWLNSPAALTLRSAIGKGRALITTYPLNNGIADDPLAQNLLASMISQVTSSRYSSQGSYNLDTRSGNALIADATTGGAEWRYSLKAPPDNWRDINFDDSAWGKGRSGFGTSSSPGAFVGTIWDTPDIWLRWNGELPSKPKRMTLIVHHDEDVKIYINGRKVWSETGYLQDYKTVALTDQVLQELELGPISVAVHCSQTTGGQYIDVGVMYD